MIPADFIQELIGRVDIVDLVGRYVALKKAGINHKGLCPFHAEKSPSFTVSASRQTYHCFGCGAHGNAVGFLMEHSGLSFVEAVKDLAQQVGLAVPELEQSPQERERAQAQKQQQLGLQEVLSRAAQHYKKQLKAHGRAVAYLKGRGLSGEVAARFGLGYAPAGWRFLSTVFAHYDDPRLMDAGLVIQSEPGEASDAEEARRYDRFRDRIMFPIRNVAGEVIGFGGRVLDAGEPKYLNSPETPVFHKGRELYGLHEARSAIRSAGYVLVVEGYMDVVALAQSGLGQAVATLGTACTAEHVQKLFRFTDTVIFSFDGDAAGRRAAARALEAVLPHATDQRQIRFLFLPPEHDPDSFVRAHGKPAFEAAVQQAVPLSRQLIERAREGMDLGEAEGRARFLRQAQPLWTALPEGALKRALLHDLSRAGGLDAAEVQALWAAASPTASQRRPTPPEATPMAGPIRGEAPAWDAGFSAAHPAAPAAPAGAGGAWRAHRPDTGMPPGPGFKVGERGPQRRTDRAYEKGFERSSWKRQAAPQPPLRQRPPGPTDHLMRLLLLNSAWLEQLSAQDMELLHQLPSPHRELLVWLEREVLNNGPQPWAVLQAALASQAWAGQIHQEMSPEELSEPPDPAQLRRLLDGLRLEALAARQTALLAQASQEPHALSAWRELEKERLAVLARLQAPPG